MGKTFRAIKKESYPKMHLYQRMVRAKLFIETNYASNIDLEQMACEACFSQYHFIRQFKNIYRKTPHQYLIFVRINKAKELLAQGMPVSGVNAAIGFESLGSFSSLFRRITGVSPSEYLARHRETRVQMADSPLAFIPGCFAAKNGWV
jgi:AraC-like DNA-binding protein